ncbi:MAG: hypothetical protein ACT4PV_07850 [Planctomycetaceae bacterium]
MIRFFLAALLALSLAACGSGKTRRVAIEDDDEITGTGLESGDIESIAALAEDLMGVPQLTGPHVTGVPTVAIHPVRNNTSQDFDAENLVRRIRQQLVNKASGKITFVTRDQMDEALIERERTEKRAGERTSSKQVTKTGADFYLTGTASSLSKTGRGYESNAIWIDFRLIDAENGELVWEKEYKTKKVGKAGVVYR